MDNATPTNESTRPRSALLALPAEIRNEIYRCALVPTATIVLPQTPQINIPEENGVYVPPDPRPWLDTDLLCVCKQIHHEALEILHKYAELGIAVNCLQIVSENDLIDIPIPSKGPLTFDQMFAKHYNDIRETKAREDLLLIPESFAYFNNIHLRSSFRETFQIVQNPEPYGGF
ncbi:hypothetical protein NA57DRAFT_52800 [Rhizodiscina lignyota]|uniref:Uncharacterized protein n=1 Tax=Rhizodiscina lignyota TaxID=1504668 RepID=A0A9P4M9W8_9PEZI|nr:hypothetical protein NA57DRAFT_52800 [Rhizodiscina lignyota]